VAERIRVLRRIGSPAEAPLATGPFNQQPLPADCFNAGVLSARLKPAVLAAVVLIGGAAAVEAPRSAVTACNGFQPTPAQTEGPYFKAGSPQRRSLVESGMPGTRLTVNGFVLTAGCKPVRRARLDFWQADANGDYDNDGFRLRGHQFTDARGAYRLETVLPALYGGRTRHIHVKVRAPGRPTLTTQLYFPNTSQNAQDGIFDRRLVVRMRTVGNRRVARFDFVLRIR
jgi:protocatechuate 3,4-dioxygenase beta subunit